MYFSHILVLQVFILLFLISNAFCKSSKLNSLKYPQGNEDKFSKRELITQFQNGQYFQDIFSEHLSPLEIIFGHVCENPKEWEQRYEHKNINDGKYQGKIRWGNKDGHYGEHYWDLNHR